MSVMLKESEGLRKTIVSPCWQISSEKSCSHHTSRIDFAQSVISPCLFSNLRALLSDSRNAKSLDLPDGGPRCIPCKVCAYDYANVRKETIEKIHDPLFLLNSTPEILWPNCMKCTISPKGEESRSVRPITITLLLL